MSINKQAIYWYIQDSFNTFNTFYPLIIKTYSLEYLNLESSTLFAIGPNSEYFLSLTDKPPICGLFAIPTKI